MLCISSDHATLAVLEAWDSRIWWVHALLSDSETRGFDGSGSSVDRESEAEGSLLPSTSKASHLSLEAQRQRLPIYKHREKLLWCVERYRAVIVVGQTGCGKSTRESSSNPAAKGSAHSAEIPQYLHEGGWTSESHVVACTQPRRVAATSVAARVAEEVGTVLGDEVRLSRTVLKDPSLIPNQVGYSIRFEDLSSPTRTRIKYMTDGMLFRECMQDPLLSKYSVIMVSTAPTQA